jgi:AraC family transcriptional regulator
MRDLVEQDLAWTGRQLEASLDIRSRSVRRLIVQLGHETRHPGFASVMATELIAGQIGIELIRYGSSLTERRAKGGLAPWRLRIIDERLAELPAAPSLAELARLCNLSVRQMTRGFRASRGYSIGDQVVQSQIDHAKRLLATEESITSIASSLGFGSPSSFSAAFRRATGVTPRQFRKNERARR